MASPIATLDLANESRRRVRKRELEWKEVHHWFSTIVFTPDRDSKMAVSKGSSH